MQPCVQAACPVLLGLPHYEDEGQRVSATKGATSLFRTMRTSAPNENPQQRLPLAPLA